MPQRVCRQGAGRGFLSRIFVCCWECTADMFKTIECIKARGEDVKEHGLEVVIEKEDDGVWRAIQERILSPEEVIHDGIDA